MCTYYIISEEFMVSLNTWRVTLGLCTTLDQFLFLVHRLCDFCYSLLLFTSGSALLSWIHPASGLWFCSAETRNCLRVDKCVSADRSDTRHAETEMSRCSKNTSTTSWPVGSVLTWVQLDPVIVECPICGFSVPVCLINWFSTSLWT